MARVQRGRYTASAGADGTVLFLIGMRINRLWQFWRWVPVMVAMPRMLMELARDPELGLVGRPRTMVSGRVITVWQYWRSFDDLDAYARAGDRSHLPAWRAFNRKVRDNGSVGIFHETIVLSDRTVETVYANMPVFGLAAVTGSEPTPHTQRSARARLTGADDAEPAGAPY